MLGLLFVVLSLVLSTLTTQRENLARSIRATVLRPVLAMQRGAIEQNSLFDDPTTLRAQRDSMAAFLVGHATLEAENRHLRDLLGLRERLPRSFVSAEVVRIPERGSGAFFQLTAGAEHGVERGASIIAAGGLVGLVRDTDASISFGLDWTHPEFRAAAMTLDGDTYGILEPRLVAGEPVLLLAGTPRHVDLTPGAMIVTSGQGGVYPAGIPIGVVIGPEEGEDGWQRNYLVRPLVSPSAMNYVLILGDPLPSAEGQDLAEAWGIRYQAGEAGEEMPAEDPTGIATGQAAATSGAGAATAGGTPGTGGQAAAPAGVASPEPLGTPVTTPTVEAAPPPPPPAPPPSAPTPPPPAPPPAAPAPTGIPPLLGDPTTPPQ